MQLLKKDSGLIKCLLSRNSPFFILAQPFSVFLQSDRTVLFSILGRGVPQGGLGHEEGADTPGDFRLSLHKST